MSFNTPLILVNFKTYQQAVGQQAVKLAKICEKVAKETKSNILVAVSPTDIFRVAKAVSIPVLAQHIDPVVYGSHTGHILPEAVLESGAVGTLLNHSENRRDIKELKSSLKRAHELGLKVCMCAKNARESKKLAKLGPDFIAVEPPELIGGDISVSTAKPGLISDTVLKVHSANQDIPVLTGAGVKNAQDVKTAIELGSEGVLIASGVTKAQDPEVALRELVRGLKTDSVKKY